MGVVKMWDEYQIGRRRGGRATAFWPTASVPGVPNGDSGAMAGWGTEVLYVERASGEGRVHILEEPAGGMGTRMNM